MQWMIASDLHGSAYYARALAEAFAREGADRLVLLGDLLYHGPRNDLPREYAPKEVIPLLNGLGDRLLCVRGNCDSEVDQMVLTFPILADYAVLALGERLVYCTHGHVWNRENLPPSGRGISSSTATPMCPPGPPLGRGTSASTRAPWPSPRRAAPTAT